MQRPHRVLIGVFGVLFAFGCASEPDDLFGDAAGGSSPLPASGGGGAGGSGALGGSGAVIPRPEQPPLSAGGSNTQGGSAAEDPTAGAGATEEPPAIGGAGTGGISGGAAGASGGGSTASGGTAQAGGASEGGRAGGGRGGAGGGGVGSGGTPSGLGGSASGGAASSATCRELRREMEDALEEAQACMPGGQGRQCAEFVDDECGCARPVDDARSLSVVAYEIARDALTELCPVTCTPMLCPAQPRSATCDEASNGSNVCVADDRPQSGPSNPGAPGGGN